MMSPSSFAVLALKFLQKSTMLTPCGPSAVPTGGAGVAFPAAIWSFTTAWIFLAIFVFHHDVTKITKPNSSSCPSCLRESNLFDLQKIQFDGRRAPENRHHYLQGVPI